MRLEDFDNDEDKLIQDRLKQNWNEIRLMIVGQFLKLWPSLRSCIHWHEQGQKIRTILLLQKNSLQN
jgi:hypothetical protein